MSFQYAHILYAPALAWEVVHLEPFPEAERALFQIVYAQTDLGEIDRTLALKVYGEVFGRKSFPHGLGPFLSAEEVHQFSEVLCERLDIVVGRVLSNFDYNELSKGLSELKDFKAIFEKGKVIQGSGMITKRGGLLGRIFKE